MKQSFIETEYGFVKYYYQIKIFASTMGVTESFTHVEYFKDVDLLKAREDAFERYPKILDEIEKQGKYFLPYASPEDFVYGENACYSATLSLVEEIEEDRIEVYEIEGESECIIAFGLDYEKFIIKSLD